MKKKVLLVLMALLPLLHTACTKEDPTNGKEEQPKEEQTTPPTEPEKDTETTDPQQGVKAVKTIEIKQMPHQTVYTLGEAFNPDGLRLKVSYTDGSMEEMDKIPTEWISGFDSQHPAQALEMKIQPTTASDDRQAASLQVEVLPIRVVQGVLMEVVESDYETLTVPEGVKEIAKEAFGQQASLVSVSLPASVTTLGDYAFHHCTKLQRVDLGPTRISVLPSGSFEGCTALTEVVFPTSLKKIGGNAFLETRALKHVRLPEGLKEIGVTAFTRSGVVKVELPHSVHTLNRAFYACSELEEVTVYGQVPATGAEEGTMEGECFNRCPRLKVLEIPGGIGRIGISAVGSCQMERLTLPAQVTHLDVNAFANVTTLKEVKLQYAGVVTAAGQPFAPGVKVRVDQNWLKEYQKDAIWKSYDIEGQ